MVCKIDICIYTNNTLDLFLNLQNKCYIDKVLFSTAKKCVFLSRFCLSLQNRPAFYCLILSVHFQSLAVFYRYMILKSRIKSTLIIPDEVSSFNTSNPKGITINTQMIIIIKATNGSLMSNILHVMHQIQTINMAIRREYISCIQNNLWCVLGITDDSLCFPHWSWSSFAHRIVDSRVFIFLLSNNILLKC